MTAFGDREPFTRAGRNWPNRSRRPFENCAIGVVLTLSEVGFDPLGFATNAGWLDGPKTP
jgi:hypothetical protein